MTKKKQAARLDTLTEILMVRMSQDQHKALAVIARREGKSMAAWVRDLVRVGLHAQEISQRCGFDTDEWFRHAIAKASAGLVLLLALTLGGCSLATTATTEVHYGPLCQRVEVVVTR
jgi:hypothetical protein